MEQELVAFAGSIAVSQCRVLNTPNLVFLCGGPTSGEKDFKSFRSVRDYFSRYIAKNNQSLASRLKRAEAINRWVDEGSFSDLLELEEYLADFADLIILFVESPGSIAELGVFAATASVRSKTLAIVNSAHPKESFIADGPVRRLRRGHPDLVRYYEWDTEGEHINDEVNIEVFEDLSRELTELLLEREKSSQKEYKLNLESPGHAMLVIADLVDITGIATISEVSECLSAFGKSFPRDVLRKYLFLLDQLRILKRLEYSTQVYYISRGRAPFIRYDFLDGAAIRDRDRAKVLIRATLKERDPRRFKVYANHLKRTQEKRERVHV